MSIVYDSGMQFISYTCKSCFAREIINIRRTKTMLECHAGRIMCGHRVSECFTNLAAVLRCKSVLRNGSTKLKTCLRKF
jgi:hypothetical protein